MRADPPRGAGVARTVRTALAPWHRRGGGRTATRSAICATGIAFALAGCASLPATEEAGTAGIVHAVNATRAANAAGDAWTRSAAGTASAANAANVSDAEQPPRATNAASPANPPDAPGTASPTTAPTAPTVPAVSTAPTASHNPPGPSAALPADDAGRFIIVAVADAPDPLPRAGTTPRPGYLGSSGYAGGSRGASAAAGVAREHRLAERAAWTIATLGLRCMLYRLPPGADRDAVLADVGRDARVQLAQPLNTYETLAAPYNDPYIGLQRGFATLNTAEAQRWSQGAGVRVALIDTAVDTAHPDLEGRIASQRDFTADARRTPPEGEQHGTEMAGVIAAGANNRIGIVGMAPQARLLVYRACWSLAAPAGAARCDSFTLAEALDAAIVAGADIINLSLGGPADALLFRLAEHAVRRGIIVVGAVPPGGGLGGFPVNVPGVLAVASADDAPPWPGVLLAPGRDILTLMPGGHYDFASGSSLAAAHVTGAIALLKSLSPGMRGEAARALLVADDRGTSLGITAGAGTNVGGRVDLCAALRRLRVDAACAGGALAANAATSNPTATGTAPGADKAAR